MANPRNMTSAQQAGQNSQNYNHLAYLGQQQQLHQQQQLANQTSGYYWNGNQWVPSGNNQQQQGSGYTAPFKFPTSTHEWEQNLLTNPAYLQKAGENPTGLNAALLYSIMASREANAATEQDFNKSMGYLDHYGEDALNEAKRATMRNSAQVGADLQGRGLGNTTLRNSLMQRERESYARVQGGINQNIGLAKSNLQAQRVRQGANNSFYTQLAAAASNPGGNNNAAYQLGGSAIGALGTLGAAYIASDSRLKKAVEVIGEATEILSTIRGVTFKYIDPSYGEGTQFGVLAQDVEEVLPELVIDGEDGFKRVNYSGLIGPMISAINELTERVKQLERARV